MSGDPTCPECGTTVLPDWDWCKGCGFDPDGLRPAVAVPAVRKERAATTAAAASALTSPPALLEVDVNQKTFGKKHLVVTPDRVVYGNDVVELASVTGYSWARTEKAAGITLDAPDGGMKVPFGKAAQDEAFDRLLEICDEILVPRLAARLLAGVRAGTPLEFGPLGVSRDGFAVSSVGRRREYTWAEFAGAHLQRSVVHVFVPSNERPQKAAEVPTSETNAAVLPLLMPRCAAEFGASTE
jgi:hypothetical protein